MCADLSFDRLDPRRRYDRDGAYDAAAFDDDLRDYPHLFDANGWPLFGSYDPYALMHPITGASWHLAPRVSRPNEPDPDYGSWYELAMALDSNALKLNVDVRRATEQAPLQDPGTENALYRMSSMQACGKTSIPRQAPLGNKNYLNSHVLPRLNKLIAHRVATPELAVLWGELCGVIETISDAVTREVRDYKSGVAGALDNREAQRKFYLHWRRYYCDEKKFSVNKANELFTRLTWRIVNDELETPDGFDKSWFQATQKKLPDSTKHNLKTRRGLANSLTRSLKDPRRQALLASAPDKEPRIPLHPSTSLRISRS